jgi:hypothetical protein
MEPPPVTIATCLELPHPLLRPTLIFLATVLMNPGSVTIKAGTAIVWRATRPTAKGLFATNATQLGRLPSEGATADQELVVDLGVVGIDRGRAKE